MPNETENLRNRESPHPVIDRISGSHDDNTVTPPRAPSRTLNTPTKAIFSWGRDMIGSFGKKIIALRPPSPQKTTAATLTDALKAVIERRSQGDDLDPIERELLHQLMLRSDPGTNYNNPNVVGIGQREYVRLPPRSEGRKSKSVRHHAKVVALVADRSTSSTPSAVLTKAFQSCDEGGGSKTLICLKRPTKEERIKNTLEFKRVECTGQVKTSKK